MIYKYLFQLNFNFRFSVAHSGGKRMIVILKEDVTQEDMPTDMAMYIKSYTYLSATDRWFWKKLIYSLPHKGKENINCFYNMLSPNRSQIQTTQMSLQTL